MKITSVTFIKAESLPAKRVVNSAMNQNVTTIIENLAKAPAGSHLCIAADDIAKFERYALQKRLQSRGAHVLVINGEHPTTKKPALFIRKLSDSEWKEYVSNLEGREKPGPRSKK